jgi:hypothetical protein
MPIDVNTSSNSNKINVTVGGGSNITVVESSNNNNIPKPNIPFGLVRTGEGLESLASTNEFYIEQLPYLSGNKYKSRYLVRNHSTKECLYYVEGKFKRANDKNAL